MLVVVKGKESIEEMLTKARHVVELFCKSCLRLANANLKGERVVKHGWRNRREQHRHVSDDKITEIGIRLASTESIHCLEKTEIQS